MPSRSLKFHASRLVLVAILVVLVGLLTGHWLVVVAVAMLIYLGWLSVNVARLYRWLRENHPDLLEFETEVSRYEQVKRWLAER